MKAGMRQVSKLIILHVIRETLIIRDTGPS